MTKDSDNPNFDLLPEAKDKTQSQIDSLVEQLSKEKDARREERFIWIICLITLLDVILFTQQPTWTAPLCILFLELIILVPIARKMGMDEIVRIFDHVLDGLAKSIKGS